jgi:hypothetical protein
MCEEIILTFDAQVEYRSSVRVNFEFSYYALHESEDNQHALT